MNTPLDNVLDRLEGVRKLRGGFQTRCPAHDDSTPSLSISTGKDGRVLLKCHAGCTTEAICAAIDLKMSDLFERIATPKPRKKLVEQYHYRDAQGRLAYQTVRYEPKGFKQRQPDDNKGWRWSLKGVDRILFRLPELLAAPADARVFICEGEKDAINVAKQGLIATTCPQGAGKWKYLSDDSALEGHPITIIADKDEPGRAHAVDVAQRLHGRVPEIRILEMPGDGNDVSDWLKAGGTSDELISLGESAPEFNPEKSSDGGENAEDEDEPIKSQATLLVELCDDVELFHHDDEAYAGVVIDGNMETMPVRGKSFKRWLDHKFFRTQGKAARSQARSDAIGVIEGKALFEGPAIAVYIRFAEQGGNIYVDLADAERLVVRITASGWDVIQNPPVRFRRPRAFQALPMPQRGGSLNLLRDYINLGDDESFILLVAWIVAAFRPGKPFPIFAFNSEQGSGKSTASRILRSLVDPNEAPIRCEPREVRDLMIASTHSWVVALDNLSHVPVWLSDSLCRLSTGGGMSTRVLYENDEECIFNVLRPVIINGIEELGTRSDLLDRTLRISLPTISEDKRRTEGELYEALERDRPLILGAILDAVSMALRNIEEVHLDRYPRMADFARWVVAAEPALPWESGAFMRAYCDNRDSAHDLAIEASPIGNPIRLFAERHIEWTGTASDLLHELEESVEQKILGRRGWPKQANSFSGMLRRLAPNFRAVGIEIVFRPRTRQGRLITVRKVGERTVTTVTDRHHTNSDAQNAYAGDDHAPLGDDGVTIATVTEPLSATQNRFGDSGDSGDDGDDEIPPLALRLQDEIDEAEERAAVMEFDGELTREEAEWRAGLHELNGRMASCQK